jgi:MFS transporter, PPP family, 3-phenylpropionic acid transporter
VTTIAGREVRPRVAIQGLFVLFGFGIAAFFPFLGIYLRGYHGLSESQIGLAIAAMALARLIANPLWGHFADTRIGRLTALQLGVGGSALAAVAFNLVDPLWAVLVVSFVHAAFMVGFGPNVDAIALVHLGEAGMADYGRIRAWESASYAVGCLLVGSILQAKGVGWALPLYAVASTIALAWSFTIERDRPTKLEGHGRLGAVGAVFHEAPRFWGFLAAVVLVWTGFNASWNFISLKIEDAGGGPWLIGFGTALGGLMEVPTMRSTSRLQRRFGVRRVFAAGCLVYATGFLLWGAVSNATVLSVLTVLEGVGFSLLFTTSVVIVGRLLPSNLYSTGNAVTAMVGFGIGPIIGAGIGGFVYQHAGPAILYAGASVLAAAAAVVAWFALATPALREPETGAAEDPGVVLGPEVGPLP